MAYKNGAQFGTLRSVAFGALTTSYAIVGAVLPSMCVSISFKNNTDGIILVSFDGITDNLVYPGLSYGVYDIRTNAPQNTDFLLGLGTAIMVKYSGSAPTSGSFYIETLLAEV